jgi:hypothetical protein
MVWIGLIWLRIGTSGGSREDDVLTLYRRIGLSRKRLVVAMRITVCLVVTMESPLSVA